jgi:hypothetical protein
MAARPTEPLKSEDVRKTYRYLRIGMVGAVVLLAVSILIERSKVACFQTSISAYYYTPVRAIFVGSLIAVGLSLIVYKGRSTWEDASLNFAGMFAPVVAVAPTTDVGRCWSVVPTPLPIQPDGSLANWVVTNIDNNFYALLIAGFVGLGIGFMTALAVDPKAPLHREGRGTWLSLGLTLLVLLFGWWLIESWNDFNTRAHGWAALLMFVFLIAAILAQAMEYRRRRDKRRWFLVYSGIAAVMILGGIVISLTRVFADHTVFALEAYEISLFAVYWIAQTREKWHEEVVDTEPVDATERRGQEP